jgi:hypothetical protein
LSENEFGEPSAPHEVNWKGLRFAWNGGKMYHFCVLIINLFNPPSDMCTETFPMVLKGAEWSVKHAQTRNRNLIILLPLPAFTFSPVKRNEKNDIYLLFGDQHNSKSNLFQALCTEIRCTVTVPFNQNRKGWLSILRLSRASWNYW